MANKQLTAKVRLNTTQAEQSIDRLVKKINQIDNAVNKTKKATTVTNQVTKATSRWATEQKKVNTLLRSSNSSLGLIRSKLKGIASTYLGIMGMKAIIGTSDIITSAENKLNYTSAQALGSKGTNADGSYSTATLNATQDAMDKMYVSSQKVRMGYTDMMGNVSKSMALAGDAFDNNTDKAIRFQEIMAEAYAIGGASQQEMSSSMYQMIQALGSGTLAGDELRSVREGAPLAYKAIEKFAQGVYNCKDSLKDMASEGMITSDMVVAAIMNAGNAMDTAFAQTEQTFAQTWEQIKNVGIRSFMPVAKMLRTALNDAIDSGLIEKVEVVFSNIAKVIIIAFTIIKNAIVWIADNWNWLKYIVGTALIVIGALHIKTAAIAIWSAIVTAATWLWANKTLIIIAGTIMLVWYIWEQFTSGVLSACEAIFYALLFIGTAILLIGVLTGSLPMIVIGAVIAILAVIFMCFEGICYGAGWLAAWIVNIVYAILNFLCAVMAVIVTFFYNLIADIVNGAMGIWNVIKAITENIGIAFSNAWIWAKNTFWEFIADVLDGLSKLEPVINGIASLLDKEGVDFGGLSSSARSRKEEYKSYVSVSDAWSSGWNTMDRMSYSDSWNAGMSTLEYKDANAWGLASRDWGAGLKDSINKWGSQFQNADDKSKEKTSLLDGIGEKLGLDFSSFGFPDPNNNDVSKLLGDGAGSVPKNVGKVADNTGKIADELDLTKEDLEYLRKVAEMEWKKEYTTANITVDMSNYNTINSDDDLDGIVAKLSDKLYEEMNIVANGVYAY